MPEYQVSPALHSINIDIPDENALAGKWTFEIVSMFSGEQSYTINIISSYRYVKEQTFKWSKETVSSKNNENDENNEQWK